LFFLLIYLAFTEIFSWSGTVMKLVSQ